MNPRLPVPLVTLLAGFCLIAGLAAQGIEDYEQAPVSYSATQPKDSIQRLELRLAAGELKLPASPKEALLVLLRELKVPLASQVVVYSKTSVQRALITPRNPRVIYFNDEAYIGWVPGGLIEVTSIDPELGPVFYTLDPRSTEPVQRPRFNRDNDCLRCHGGSFVRGVPGVFVRSVPTDQQGEPLLQFGSQVVDHRTPFKERWGGWYVTGKHGTETHQGNVFGRVRNGDLEIEHSRGSNVTDLSRFFAVGDYPASTSDVVALMVMEHQTAMHNALTRAAFNCRRMLAYQQNLQRDLGEKQTPEPSYESVKRVFASAAQEVLDHLLFKDEAPLPAGLEGSAAFQQSYLDGAVQTRDGRSLRQFRLQHHLFKYRCSHLIYSAQFLALPGPLKHLLYDRLAAVLTTDEPDPRYDHLGRRERTEIYEILRETHPELRTRWAGERRAATR